MAAAFEERSKPAAHGVAASAGLTANRPAVCDGWTVLQAVLRHLRRGDVVHQAAQKGNRGERGLSDVEDKQTRRRKQVGGAEASGRTSDNHIHRIKSAP